MGISLKDQRRRKGRRSYADYKPPDRRPGPRNDPFRMLFYIVLIAGGIWVYVNQDAVRTELFGAMAASSPAAQTSSAGGQRPTPQGDQAAAADVNADQLAADATLAYEEGRLLDAIELYEQAAQANPDNGTYYVQMARLLIFQSAMSYGDERVAMLDRALEAANNAVLVAPEDPAGFAIMGKVYDWQGRPDKASSTILRATELDADYALGHSYLAEALVDLDRWDQALETIDIALELAPNHVDVRRDYAYILEYLSDYSAAITQYETALELHPRLNYLRLALSRAYRVNGQYDQALDQLFEAQLIEPGNPLIPFELGRTYETYIGDPNSALDNYERAVEMDSQFGAAWLRIGTLNYFQGSYPRAIAAFERALELEAESDVMYYQLGLSYANEGRCSDATRYLTEAQQRSADNEQILDAIQTGLELCQQPSSTLPAGTPTPAP